MALNQTLKRVLWVLPLTIIVGGITVYAASASLRGKITVWMWSGKKTLRCDGSDVLVIRGKTAHTQSQVIYATDRCKVRIINCKLTGGTVIYARNNARVTIIDSKLSGETHGVFIYDGARAVIRGSTIAAKRAGVHLGQGAEVTITKSKIHSGRAALYVGKGARATVTDSELRSDNERAIYTGSKAELVVTRGTLMGVDGVTAGDRSKVTLKDAKLVVRDGAFQVSTKGLLTVSNCKVQGGKDGVYVSRDGRLRMSKTDLLVRSRPVYASRGSDLEISDCKLKGGNGGVYVSNRAKVRLRRIDLRSNSGGLYVSRDATVMFDGGKLISAGRAIYAAKGANITLRKVKLVGSIHKDQGATITQVGSGGNLGLAAQRASELNRRLERYKKTACWGVLTCYQRHQQWGAVDVTIKVNIDEEGKAVKPVVTLRKRVKAGVRKCLEDNAKKRRLQKFTGPRGVLLCRITGTMQDGVQLLSHQREYNVDPAVLKKAKAGALPDVE